MTVAQIAQAMCETDEFVRWPGYEDARRRRFGLRAISIEEEVRK